LMVFDRLHTDGRSDVGLPVPGPPTSTILLASSRKSPR
jgi:hypothetical protein